MDTETIIAIVAAGVGVLITPIYVLLLVKGVRSLSDIRDMFARPPGSYRDQ